MFLQIGCSITQAFRALCEQSNAKVTRFAQQFTRLGKRMVVINYQRIRYLMADSAFPHLGGASIFILVRRHSVTSPKFLCLYPRPSRTNGALLRGTAPSICLLGESLLIRQHTFSITWGTDKPFTRLDFGTSACFTNLCNCHQCNTPLIDAIIYLCDDFGNPKLPEQGKGEHNALADARWNKQVYDFLKEFSRNEVR